MPLSLMTVTLLMGLLLRLGEHVGQVGVEVPMHVAGTSL